MKNAVALRFLSRSIIIVMSIASITVVANALDGVGAGGGGADGELKIVGYGCKRDERPNDGDLTAFSVQKSVVKSVVGKFDLKFSLVEGGLRSPDEAPILINDAEIGIGLNCIFDSKSHDLESCASADGLTIVKLTKVDSRYTVQIESPSFNSPNPNSLRRRLDGQSALVFSFEPSACSTYLSYGN